MPVVRSEMSIRKKHFGHVNEDMTLEFFDVIAWKQELLNHKGKDVSVTVSRKRKRRSVNQNDYFHAVICVMFSEEMGCSPDEAKEALKFHFLRKKSNTGLEYCRKTSELSTVEFEEFCSKCRMLGSEMFGAYIPLPNEIEY